MIQIQDFIRREFSVIVFVFLIFSLKENKIVLGRIICRNDKRY